MSKQKKPLPSPRPPGDINPRNDPPLDFPDCGLDEMSAAGYRDLGFMAGLEVHQQLLTRRKLFCRCPAGRSVKHFDAEVLRHMRPTLSELGEYDGTALMEFKTRKEIVYLLERGSVCTYEIDDTPPFAIDEHAVRIAIEVAQLCNLSLVSELHVMRKQYLDGSIPTGFQRTAMIGLGGAIQLTIPELNVNKELRIRQLSLEEDSCREVSDEGHEITFRTDRLGIPLTEIVTEPDLVTPGEVQAAARLLARTAQATNKVRRGPGAARQDVNVSVAGGRRIEIKGVDNHRNLPRLVHIEAFRQLNLLRIREELQKRGVPTDMLDLPESGLPWEASPLVVEAENAVRRCEFAPIRNALDRGDSIKALRLPGFGGMLAHRTQPGVTFAREIGDRVRVIACLTTRPFMLHSDVPDFGLDPSQWRTLRQRLHANQWDAIIVFWGPEHDVATAIRETFIRASEALDGVPAETRQAFSDGTNGFERILPGPDRMYPDTDTPPLPIPDTWVAEIAAQLPEQPWVREQRYRGMGLTPAMASELAGAPWSDLFDELAPPPGEIARRLACGLQKRLIHRSRQTGEMKLPAAERLQPLVAAIEQDRIRVEALERALDALLSERQNATEEILQRFSRRESDEKALDEAIADVVRARESLNHSPDENGALMRWAMGRVMPGLMGKFSPLLVTERLKVALGLVST